MDAADRKRILFLLDLLGVDPKEKKPGKGKLVLLSGGTVSGKTTIAKKIKRAHPEFSVINTGDFFREEAKRLGIGISEFMGSKDDSLARLDRAVDARTLRILLETDKDIILTSRFAALWGEILKMAGKPCLSIFLEVGREETVGRLSLREFGKEEARLSEGQKSRLAEELKRDERDTLRYIRVYGLNPQDYGKYAHVINTTGNTQEGTWEKVRPLLERFLPENRPD
ncbi:MAG: AAA family ATPase [Candidatus Aenigmatarchaeota archaeon]